MRTHRTAFNEDFIKKSKQEKIEETYKHLQEILNLERTFVLAFGTNQSIDEIINLINTKQENKVDFTHCLYSDKITKQEMVGFIQEMIETAIKQSNIYTEERPINETPTKEDKTPK